MSNVAGEQQDPKKPDMSEREESKIADVMSKIDLGQLLVQDSVEVRFNLSKRLEVGYRSQTASAAFDCEDYLEDLEKDGGPMSQVSRYQHRLLWSLANSLTLFAGQPFMPGAGAGTKHVKDKILRLREKSKHILDQLLWGQSIFEEALRRVVEDDDDGFEDRIKNS